MLIFVFLKNFLLKLFRRTPILGVNCAPARAHKKCRKTQMGDSFGVLKAFGAGSNARRKLHNPI
ncbi:MAG: hypothetical protein BHW65_05920 [Verrucomicrobia bacterium CAG:312_58_20]|nr:MAG: hypothetical protein BHW65_05920 [Verrucomicrobia bacterium CAG:312_58_20]